MEWLLFLALGFMWGSAYLFIKIGVDHGLQPFTLITRRHLALTWGAPIEEPLPPLCERFSDAGELYVVEGYLV